ncbi:probable G-protein coupled receptor 132b [Colossoma macropomum]|uniref:probable G-protein coupled receptor 132b n=1 Tax=Colossoma macropomum TaxID=42526 RepID=UPI00186497A0|nr:probable G-protein coupled receptor 132b [Colossoma macropomum]
MHERTVTQTSVTVMNGNVNLTCTTPYNEDRIPLVVLYSVVLIVGLPANLATMYLTYLQVRRKNVLGIYLLSLSICDFTYLLTLPTWAIYVNGGHRWPWSSLACQVTGYVFFTNMYISIFLLCCVSIDRYVAVVYAVESRGLRHQRLATLVTLTICVVVGLGHAPVFNMPEGNAAIGERHCFEPSQSTATITGFNYARFCLGFFAPLAVLIFTNRAILANVRASTGLRPCQKDKVRLLAVAVVLLFMVCFGPYHIILLMRAITYHFPHLQEDCHFERCVYTPYTISLGLSTINSAINPILYVLSSDNIHKEIRSCVAGFWTRTALRQRSTESSQHKMQNSKNSSDMLPIQDQDKTRTPTPC